ncbi:uncharacterized protein LOC134537593 [Bacillus rossius redtenbacheri]|uniref:uncharacterized protein LOC134537593 n=1 Tax=Bacillus rossius redtenbacheri TaxID=93214 RepID=UPI002FDE9FF2
MPRQRPPGAAAKHLHLRLATTVLLAGVFALCHSFSTYKTNRVKAPYPELLSGLAAKCRVSDGRRRDLFQDVVRVMTLRRQPGPDFDKCLAYCMMANMNMFHPHGTLMDAANAVREFGPYFDNYEQDKITRCVLEVNNMLLGRGGYVRCLRATAFLSCFNKGVFLLTWENLLLDEASRCRKKLQMNDTLELIVVDYIFHRRTPDDNFPECILQCMFRELRMFKNESADLLSTENTLDSIGYYFEEADKRKIICCIKEANGIVKSRFMKPNCMSSRLFLECFNTPPVYTPFGVSSSRLNVRNMTGSFGTTAVVEEHEEVTKSSC